MVVVNLVCGIEENGRRIESAERKARTEGMEKGKLVDRTLLERFHEEYELLDLQALQGGGRVRLLCHNVETTKLSAREATDVVWRLLRRELGF